MHRSKRYEDLNRLWQWPQEKMYQFQNILCSILKNLFILFLLIEVMRSSLQNGLDVLPLALHGSSYTISGLACVTNTIWWKYCRESFEASYCKILLLSNILLSLMTQAR